MTVRKGQLTVPSSAGRKGLLEVVGRLLRLPRLQEFRVLAGAGSATISYEHLMESDAEPIEIDVSMFDPYDIILTGHMEEVLSSEPNPLLALHELLRAPLRENRVATGLVAAPVSPWWVALTGVEDPPRFFAGVPVFVSTKVDSETLFAASASEYGSDLADSRFIYRMVFPCK